MSREGSEHGSRYSHPIGLYVYLRCYQGIGESGIHWHRALDGVEVKNEGTKYRRTEGRLTFNAIKPSSFGIDRSLFEKGDEFPWVVYFDGFLVSR